MNKFFVYDGDTIWERRDGEGAPSRHTPRPERIDYRLDGVDTFELDRTGGPQARQATQHMLDSGYELNPIGEEDRHGRQLATLTREGDVSGSQALVNLGLGHALPGDMNRTVNPAMRTFREITGKAIPEDSIENDLVLRHLAEEARAERLARINTLLESPGGLMGRSTTLPMASDPEERGHVDRAWDRGVDNMQATFYGFANALGEASGIDVLAEWGEEGMSRNIWEAMRSPASVGTWENIDSLADAGIYALEALAEHAPQLALDGAIALGAGALATTGAGAPAAAGAIMTRHALAGIGKAVLRKAGTDAVPNAMVVAREGIRRSDLFKEGARFGALSSMYPQLVGETQLSFTAEGVDAPGTALALGVPKALLDLYGFEKILGQAFKGLGKDAATPENVGQLLMGTLKAGGIAATAESVTEATQYLIDELALNAKVPGREIEWAGAIDSLLKGGLVGGATSGASRLGVDALRMGASVEVPGADAPPQPTLPEPLRDMGPQLDSTPPGEGRWFTSENAEQAKAAAAERGLPTKEAPDGSVFVAEQSVLDTIPEEPTQADIARVVGYVQTKDEALADPQGAVVVETRNAEGAVLRNQLVGASIAEAVRQLQAEKFPEGQTAIINVESAVAERSEAVQREQWEPKGLLSKRDPAELIRQAEEAGVDPSRFLKDGFGQELVNRIVGGLRSVTGPNKYRRLDSLESLASLLDMDPQDLHRNRYGENRVIQSRQKLLEVFEQRVAEKFGSMEAFAQAVDNLPRPEVRKIAEALEVEGEGGFDIAGLVAEIEARRRETSEQPAPEKPAPEEQVEQTEQGVDPEALAARRSKVKENLRVLQNALTPGMPRTQRDRIREGIAASQNELRHLESELIKAGLRDAEPAIERTIRGEDGAVLLGDALEARIEAMPRRERLQMEAALEALKIDIGGANRSGFIAMLRAALTPTAEIQTGTQLVETDDPDSPAAEAVQFTEEGELSEADEQFIKLVEQTPLDDRAADGWPSGAALYMEAIARIHQATDAKAVEQAGGIGSKQRLRYAGSLVVMLHGLVDAVDGFDPTAYYELVADLTGLTDEAASQAAGRDLSRTEALALMAREDGRVGYALAAQMGRGYDFSITDEQGREALAEAIQADPEQTLTDVLNDMLNLYGEDGPDRLALILMYEQSVDMERGRDRPLTATAKGRDAGTGEDSVAVDIQAPEGEQAMSDATFFRALQRMSIAHWNAAILPTAEQREGLLFGYTSNSNGVAKANTERADGQNLLALPEVEGTLYGRVVDAISLAAFAQSGERAPQNVAEAATNLLENLSRLMLGAQNSEYVGSFGVGRGFIDTIPDNLVIFLNRESGEPETFGQAMEAMARSKEAEVRRVALSREIDLLSDQADLIQESLYEALEQEVAEAAAKYAKRDPLYGEALALWLTMVSGEKHSVAGRKVYSRKPSRMGDKRLRSAVDALGRVDITITTVDGDGNRSSERTNLTNAYDKYLSLRGEVGRKAKQRRKEAEDRLEALGYEYDDVAAAARELGLEPYEVDPNDAAMMRAIDEVLREGQRNSEEVGSRLIEESPDSEAVPPHASEALERQPSDAREAAERVMSERDTSDTPEMTAQRQALIAWGERLKEADGLEAQREERAAQRKKDEQARYERWVQDNGLTDTGSARMAWTTIQGVLRALDDVDPSIFGLKSTIKATEQPVGMAVEDVLQIAEEFLSGYKGNIHLEIRVRQTQEEIYGPTRNDSEGRPIRIKGAYHPATAGQRDSAAPDVLPRGVLTLVADNLNDKADVVETLRHEILGHYGLNTFPPAVKRQILDAILASKNVPGMKALWADISKRYKDDPADVQAEEVFALVVENPNLNLTLVQRILNWLAMAMRRLGLLDGKVTRAELLAMAEQISGAIRDGRARQRNWPQTSYESFRKAVPDATLLGAKAKRFWKTGTGMAAPVISMVHSRISRYSPELSRMLFQPANADASAHGQSWQQRTRALEGRMMGQVDKLLSDLYAKAEGGKIVRQQAVQKAFEDAYSGEPKTEDGKRIRALVDSLVAEAKKAGLQSVEFGENFAPVAFDRKIVDARRGEFEQLLLDKLKDRDGKPVRPKDVAEIVRNILDGPGVLEGVIAPGMPVGMHENTRAIVEAVGLDTLMEQGWLLQRHEAALFHWVSGVSKRASWEAIFGGEDITRYAMRDGKEVAGYSPNAKFHEHLDAIREEHGQRAVDEVLALVNGALGRHPAGQSMPGWWRTTQEFITGWVGMTVLAFSGVASIPELALPLVRAGGKVGIGAAVSDFAQAKRLARDLGIVLSDASEQVVWQMTGEQYQSPTIQKMQSLFFKINGNNLIVRTSRILATGIAVRYLLNAAATNDTVSLKKLNIDAGTIHAWDQAGRPAWSPDMDPVMADISSQVADAINQFVNEATLNPSRFQATHWGNNPWLKMIWHLKHFLYTYGDTVLGGMYREMRRRWRHLDPTQFSHAVAIAMPALIFGLAVMPLAAASLELRDWVRRWNGQRGKEYEDSLAYIRAIFDRAGGLGPVEFLINLRQQQEWGRSVFGAVAPVPGKVDTILGRGSVESKVRQMIPIWSQNKGLPLPWE